MDRSERSPHPEEVLRLAFQAMQSRMWTALPGIIERVGVGQKRMTVDVQPTINGQQRARDSSSSSLRMPVLLDCPILWQGGGGVTLTFPVSPGDECLVIFSARCIDAWWSQGGVQDPPEFRMHNLSDGFALVGVRSMPNAFDLDMTAAVLRSNDGSTFLKLDPQTQKVTITAPGGIDLNGVAIDADSNVQTSATITADTDVIAAGISGKGHHHNEHDGPPTTPPVPE